MTLRAHLLLLGSLTAAALALGCSTPPIEVPKTVEVEIPVACLRPEDVPPLPAVRAIADLMAMDTYRRTLAAWSDLRRLEAYAAKLEALVTGCARLPPAKPP